MTPTTAATQERTTDARVPLPRGTAKDMATRADEGFFGPGKLSRDEENEYWEQMVTAVEESTKAFSKAS